MTIPPPLTRQGLLAHRIGIKHLGSRLDGSIKKTACLPFFVPIGNNQQSDKLAPNSEKKPAHSRPPWTAQNPEQANVERAILHQRRRPSIHTQLRLHLHSGPHQFPGFRPGTNHSLVLGPHGLTPLQSSRPKTTLSPQSPAVGPILSPFCNFGPRAPSAPSLLLASASQSTPPPCTTAESPNCSLVNTLCSVLQ